MKQLFILSFLSFCQIYGQSISGKISEKGTGTPVSFVKIVAKSGEKLLSDENGNYVLNKTQLPAIIIFSMEEYKTDTVEVTTSIYNHVMSRKEEVINVVVSASRREQKLEEVSVSMEVLKPELLQNKGYTDLEQAVDQAPGVYSMDGQVSIRGGSGFAYGAGSRVLLLMNEMPQMAADIGDVKWNSIGLENVERIEIIKGASSVLYGAGALNGIISITEKEPTRKGEGFVKMQVGFYDKMARQSLNWSPRRLSFHSGDFYYGKMFKQVGFTISAFGLTNDGIKQGEEELRGRVNGMFYFRPAKIKGLKVSVAFSYQKQTQGNFILWESDSLGFTPKGGPDTANVASTLTYQRAARFNIDPVIKYTDKWNNKHALRTRYYLTANDNLNNNNQSTQGEVFYADYQFQKVWNKMWYLTVGATGNISKVKSFIFGDHGSRNIAAYAQLDWKWKKLDITGGMRAEYFKMDDLQPDSRYQIETSSLPFFIKDIQTNVYPVFRAAAHYALFKFTHLRASYGQGIRYPAVSERYTTASVGSLNVFPNPALVPETGWAGEIGIKQGVKIGNWKAFIDVAAFVNKYANMMEFTFGNYKPANIPLSFNPNNPGYFFKWIGFQAKNAESARIRGIETSITGEGNIGKFHIVTLAGYTYMDPRSLGTDPEYLKTFSDSGNNMLKYRFKHLAKADLQISYKIFTIGFSMRYNSYMENIDQTFVDKFIGPLILKGYEKYRNDRNGDPNIVGDFRVGFDVKDFMKVNFLMNNVFNAEYSTRPADIQAPRTFIAQIQYKI